MTSSRRDAAPRQVPPPPNSRGGVAYSRFIPAEELQGFSAWLPDAFGDPSAPGAKAGFSRADHRPPGTRAAQAANVAVNPNHNATHNASHNAAPSKASNFGAQAAPAAAEPAPPAADVPTLEELHAEMQAEMQVQVAAARTQGYQDGYRDGLVALESFKQSYATQVSSQLGGLLHAMDHELGQLEQQIAGSVAKVATELARQVVRGELSVRPALVAQVAQEAVNTVLMSARHITVHVNPDDHALVAQGCTEALAARGARLLSQPNVARGGCRIESDAGAIDARIGTRWAQATQALGTGVSWTDDEANQTDAGGDA